VVVLCGGDGAEREVSLRSGRAVAEALRTGPFDVTEWDLRSLGEVQELREGGFDFAFIALHGDWGEDGTLQSVLSVMGLPYTGSRPAACKAAMHKGTSRVLFARAGLQVPKGLLFSVDSEVDVDAITEFLGGHVVVKPCSGGSTVGVTLVTRPEEIPDAIDKAFLHDSGVLIEEYVAGRELTVAVLERGRKTVPLPVIEIVPRHGFYDYDNKYAAGATEYLVPAPLDEAVYARVTADALTAHRCLACRAYSRSDFRLSSDGVPWILEVNTAPGMTSTSLVPKAARAAGLSFPALARAIISASR
jgi:D-alanine-D-alanine ligase